MDIQKNELLKVIFKTPKLKERIDIALDEHSKINAIKELRGWCETTSYPAWLKDLAPKLRLSKDVIDAYCVRVSILRKLNKLSNQIEKYCNKHGYNKMGYRLKESSKFICLIKVFLHFVIAINCLIKVFCICLIKVFLHCVIAINCLIKVFCIV